MKSGPLRLYQCSEDALLTLPEATDTNRVDGFSCHNYMVFTQGVCRKIPLTKPLDFGEATLKARTAHSVLFTLKLC